MNVLVLIMALGGLSPSLAQPSIDNTAPEHSSQNISGEAFKKERTIYEPIAAALVIGPHLRPRTLTTEATGIPSSNTSATAGEFALQDDATIYYGEEGFERGVGMHVAKLDLSGNRNDTKVLCTEHFRDSVKGVTCEGQVVKFVFADDTDFPRLQQDWAWVNEGKRSIFLITESDNCDRNQTDDTSRQPWEVSKAVFDEGARKAELTAEPKDWDIFGEHWHLRITRDEPDEETQQPNSLEKRAKVAGVDLHHDFSGLGFQLPPPLNPFKKDKPFGSVEVSGSFAGSLDFDVELDGKGLGTIKAIARGMKASLNVRLNIYEAKREQSLWEQEIIGYVPPGAGIYIKGLLDIGPTIKTLLSTQYESPPDKPFSLVTGYNLTVPEPSEFTWNILHASEPKLEGFRPEFEAIQPRISDDVATDLQIGPKLGVTFDAKILGRGFSAGLYFAASSLSIKTLTMEEDSSCSKKDKKDSVKLDVDLVQQIEAFQKANIVVAKTAATQTLASTRYDLLTACLPVDKGMTIATAAPTASTKNYIPNPGGVGHAVKSVFSKVEGRLSTVFVDKIGSPVTSVAHEVKAEATEAVAKVTKGVGKVWDKIF